MMIIMIKYIKLLIKYNTNVINLMYLPNNRLVSWGVDMQKANILRVFCGFETKE